MTITYRDLAGLREFRAAHAMQSVVWGADDLTDPPDLMMVIQSEGGIVAGAFDGDRIVGYVFGFPASDMAVQHSHRLAVLPEYRGFGIGARLKTYQREWCRARGIRIIRWTYDPLLVRNAHLNMVHLGAIGCRYLINYYGNEGSYQAGIDTDRVVAEMHVMGRPDTKIEAVAPIPPNFAELMHHDPAAARAMRLATRASLIRLFDADLVIVGFDRAACRYEFGSLSA